MLPKRNTFYNNKAPVDNDLSLAARRYQQASHPPITGIRFRSFYSAPAPTSNLFMVSGFLVNSARGAVTVLQGGQV